MKEKLSAFYAKDSTQKVVASLLSILIGLVVGSLVILIVGLTSKSISTKGAWEGIRLIFAGIFSTGRDASGALSWGFNPTSVGNMLFRATPLIMTGLSIAVAYKTGLFNIGAPGQYTIGAMAALFFALVIKAPWYVCVLMSIVGGAIWGFFPGLFKALFNVNEVITSIMMNWIGMNCANLLVLSVKKMLASDGARSLALDAGNPSAIMPRLGLDKLYVYLNIGIFIAAIIAVIVWFVMSKTTFGYELRACGLNRDGAIYAGINAKRNIVLSVVIAGALAGLGGGLCYLAGGVQYTTEQTILSMGFDGISVALLANSHPIGCIFSAIFISYLKLGGIAMQSQGYATEATDIVTAVIIYLAAFSLLLRIKLSSVFNGKKKEVA